MEIMLVQIKVNQYIVCILPNLEVLMSPSGILTTCLQQESNQIFTISRSSGVPLMKYIMSQTIQA